MNPRNWLLTTLLTLLVTAGAVAGLNIELDPYGLYWPDRGRHLPVYGDERVAKYLLAMRYVPENFNALIIGASITASWDIRAIENLRVYNGSINGGNIVEEKALIDAAIDKPGISAVLLIVHPALTYAHIFRTVEMKPDLKRSSLGSMSLWDAYKDMINVRLGRLPQKFDDNGTEFPLVLYSEMNNLMKQMWNAPEFVVDPVALQAYKDVVAALRQRGIKIIFIIPPTSEQILKTKRANLERYVQQMRSEIGPGDLWIDFMTPEHQEFCSGRSNFTDGVHLSPPGARHVVAYINDSIKGFLADGRLTLPASAR
jgi:hypothetical protein